MTDKRVSLSKLFNNNKFAFAVSVVLAVVIWLGIAMSVSEPQEVALAEIPVSIDTTMTDKLDLQMFGQTEFTVTVKLNGKRYEVSSAVLSKDDFSVTASTVNVSSAGKYSLPITVKPKDATRGIEVVSFSPETVDVYFDYNLTENYPVEVQLNAKDDIVAAEGYIDGEPLLSSSEVTVTGAASEVQKIARIVAKVNLQSPLTETTKFENTDLAILNENGGIVRSAYVSVADSIANVTVTVPIFKVTDFKPSVRFKNTPQYFLGHPISYICSPSGMVNAAVSTELLGSAESLSLGTIDFADVTAGANTFVFNASEIPNIRILDDVEEFRVFFSLDGLQTRKIMLSTENITFKNLPADGTAAVDELTLPQVTLVGLPNEIDTVGTSGVKAVVDVSGLQKGADAVELPMTFTVENTTGCWISGSYTVSVSVS